VHLLVTVHNNKRCTVHSIKINSRSLCFRRTESPSMATSAVSVMSTDMGFINTAVFRCSDVQRVYTKSSYTRKPVFVPFCGDRYSGVTLCLWSHQNSNYHAMLKPRVTNVAGSSYDTETLRHGEYCHLLSISKTQWLLHIAAPALTIKTSALCLQNTFTCHVSFSKWRAIIPPDKLYCWYFQCSVFLAKGKYFVDTFQA